MSKVVTVFGSARIPSGAPEYELAYTVGRELAAAGFTVCNGGYGGTMEASARGAKDAGGTTVGVSFNSVGRTPNQWIDRVVPTSHLSERLLKLVELGDGYVVLKGGTGTLLELACVWEFVNKGIMPVKPIVLLGRFWEPIIQTLREEQQWEGLGDCTTHLHVAETPKECVEMLREGLRG